MHLTDCVLASSSNEEVCWVALKFYKFVNQFIHFEFDSHCCSTLTWAPWQESRDFSLRNCLLTKRGWFLSCRRSLSIWIGCWVAFQLPEMIAASTNPPPPLQKRTHNVLKISNIKYVPLPVVQLQPFSSLSWGLLQIVKGWPIRHSKCGLDGFNDKNGSVF